MNTYKKMEYFSLLDLITDGYLLLNNEGIICHANTALIRLLGYQKSELIGQPLSLIDQELSGKAFNERYLLSSNQGINKLEVMYLCKNNNKKLLELTISSHSCFAESILVAIRDISKQHKTKSWFSIARKIFSHSSEAIVITDHLGSIELVNQAFTKISGYTTTEMVGKSLYQLNSGRQDKQFYQRLWFELSEKSYWSGEIWSKRKNGEIYAEWLNITSIKNEAGEVTNYVAQFVDTTALKNAEIKQQYQIYHDPLTSLPNRRLLFERFESLTRDYETEPMRFSILCCDLDRFKSINDSYGHHIGDELLKLVAKRIKDKIRSTDIIARSGGDEFIIVIVGDDAVVHIDKIANQLQTLFQQPFATPYGPIYTTCSIGISNYPYDSTDVSELISFAEVTMDKVKRQGGNNFSFFDAKQKQSLLHQIELEKSMYQALAKQQFEVWYQPQVNDLDNSLYGVECLLRWRHPEYGLISPNVFIPIAEKNGLIKDIGFYVLKTACQQLKCWQDSKLFSGKFAVNVSLRQFDGTSLVTEVESLLDHMEIAGSTIELEVTESLFSEEDNLCIDKLNSLRAHGIKVAIDDFGTGYSSLSRLKNLPIDNLKIDKSFIDEIDTNPDSIAVIKVLVLLANSFNLNVIAEGVETDTQAEILNNLGCFNHQGYLYSKPLPAQDFEHWLAASSHNNTQMV